MKKNRELIVSGDVYQALKTMTLPMTFGIWGIVAFNLADTYFVGKLGTLQMAALTFTFPVVLIVNSLSLGIGVGTSSILSQAVGTNNKTTVKEIATGSIILGLLVAFCILIVGEFTIDPVFKMIGADNSTLPYVKAYIRIWYFAVPINIVQMIGNNILRGLGDSKTPSFIMLSAAFLNIILDPLLIMGIWIFPNFSVAGAALATLLSRMVTFIFELYVLIIREKVLSLKVITVQSLLSSWKKILYVGIPNAIAKMIIPIGAGIITGLIANFGAESVAAFGIATKIEFFAISVIQALVAVIPVFVGQNFGAKQFDRIFQGIRISEKFSFAYGIIIYMLLFVLAKPLALLFSKETVVVNNIIKYIRIVPLGYFFYSILLIINAALNALRRPVHGALLSASQMFLFYVPLAFMLSKPFGTTGIFISLAVSYMLSGAMSYVYIKNLEKNFEQQNI